ncbi:hypothetical protein JRI60_30755 [Archangium violaceum]|uniref:LysR substrate-binding domain-containing protein n=1 Tax=Archangium violaceum TaxID=83451 RepID=UPI001950792E|nr:LysR substrate-binding domain-containing protein [Archangium violaceum]QRN93550.1 hypothetical protein JRI60_30755 [Archangium violaceum]
MMSVASSRTAPLTATAALAPRASNFSVDVPDRVLTNDSAFNLRLARAGVGITLSDDRVRDQVARGEWVTVLEEFSTPYPGFFLYYPQRRHASPALRALIDYLRQARQQASAPARSQRRKQARRDDR